MRLTVWFLFIVKTLSLWQGRGQGEGFQRNLNKRFGLEIFAIG
jgi:hypothetical protein